MIPEAWQFYIATLIVLYAVTLIAAFGLNLQYGVTGILNFGYAVPIGVGGYTAALLTLGPPQGRFQTYWFGLELPFPLPWLAAAAMGALVSLALGFIVAGRLRGDYQAIVLLAVSVIATRLVQVQKEIVNGGAGLANVPQPLRDFVDSSIAYQWLYVGLAVAVAGGTWFVVHRISRAPLGRALRAVRDSPEVAAALGKDVARLQLLVMAIGGAAGGLSGAMTAQYLTGWNPESWLLLVTFTYFTGIILGGAGNALGVAVGIALIPIGFREATRFLPAIGYPGLIEALQWVVIGLLALLVLWLRPAGIVPERVVAYEPTGRARWHIGRRGRS
ncbi:MAG: branched-chain amino acid ABC transporter permease [Chloroflexota bacterium]